ncbi:SGNH/GDSL hydrolase family protein [Spirosoma sp. KUDC1026]|uniref:SGNH/GDSL hydrolase family protein n=1 Tax=Spirosoma sp. KUDC1026 TaxID=2745947 RepID=UPI00159BD68C|nr:SGNH/GDSL hydrolase family protein [Spirosoma sp. KUDC1026]QKZ14858.1 SGNH/GDSL hydrolase family protein [Spirosoma sp. KUDC1026]
MSSNTSRRAFLKSSALAGLAAEPLLVAAPVPMPEPRAEKGLVFLFQGDSITDGNRGRTTDPNHIMGHGYAFSIASRIGADFPESGFSFYNRGISGNTVTDLQKRWSVDTLALKPDVLSLLVGINDTDLVVNKPAEATSLEQFESTYRGLLTDSRNQHAACLFVLGLPFVYPVGQRSENWERWRDDTAQRQGIVRKLAAEFNAILVDYPALFDKALTKAPIDYWIWDGIHPTVFAHELMAREWIKQVSSQLTFLKKYR